MNEEDNSNKKIKNLDADVVKAIENYLHKFEEGNIEDNENINLTFTKLKTFLKNLKNDYSNIDRQFNVEKSKSILSFMDIDIVIADDNNQIKVNDNKNQESVTKTPVIFYKEISTNTENIVCEKSCQTIKPKKITNLQESIKDKNNLTLQCDQIQDLIVTFMKKKERLINKKDEAYKNSLNFIKFFKSLSVAVVDVGVQTNDSWLRDFKLMLSEMSQLTDAKEKLKLSTIKKEGLLLLIGCQSREMESQFESIEELTNKNLEFIKRKEIIDNELMEMKEMNEFLESENKGLTTTIDKLGEDFEVYKTYQNGRLEELSSFHNRTERCRWLVDRRTCRQKFIDQERDFMLVTQENEDSKIRLERIKISLKDYLEFNEEHGKLKTDLKKKIKIAEKKLEIQRRDRIIWEALKKSALEKREQEDCTLNKNVEMLKMECDRVQGDFKKVREENERYRSCFSDIRTIYLNSRERSSHNDIDLYREIFSKYE